MDKEVQETLREFIELSASLGEELEATLIEKKACDEKIKSLENEVASLKKSATKNEQEKVLLEKVASHGIVSPHLIPVLGKLEKAGFIKQGSSMEAYEDLQRRPDRLINLIEEIADSFSADFDMEGNLEKSASTATLPKEGNSEAYIDEDGWSRILTEGA